MAGAECQGEEFSPLRSCNSSILRLERKMTNRPERLWTQKYLNKSRNLDIKKIRKHNWLVIRKWQSKSNIMLHSPEAKRRMEDCWKSESISM